MERDFFFIGNKEKQTGKKYTYSALFWFWEMKNWSLD